MVQTQMGLAPYQPINYEVIDAVPSTVKTKKMVVENGVWQERIFIRIPVNTLPMIRGTKENNYQSMTMLEQWCREHYKEPRYQGRWFKIDGHIILDDRTYVHWKLCE